MRCLAIVGLTVHRICNDLLTANWARVMRLIDPAIEAGRVEDVLRMALKSSDLVRLVEVVQADSAGVFELVHNGVEIFTGKRR